MAGVEFAALVTVVGGGFVATNLDNLLILVGLLGAARRRGAILVGYMAASLSVLIVALLGGLVGGLIDPAMVGYLGIIPLLMGGYLLSRALFPPAVAAPETEAPTECRVESGTAGGLSGCHYFRGSDLSAPGPALDYGCPACCRAGSGCPLAPALRPLGRAGRHDGRWRLHPGGHRDRQTSCRLN